MNPQTLAATLSAMRKAGSVFGVLFARGDTPLFSDLAYTPERVAAFASVLADISAYFEQSERRPETLAFTFDGGSLVLFLREGHRLAVLHHRSDEADFIAKAGSAFLQDYFAAKAAERFLAKPSPGGTPASPPPAANAGPPPPRRPGDGISHSVPLSQSPHATAPITPLRPPVEPAAPLSPPSGAA